MPRKQRYASARSVHWGESATALGVRYLSTRQFVLGEHSSQSSYRLHLRDTSTLNRVRVVGVGLAQLMSLTDAKAGAAAARAAASARTNVIIRRRMVEPPDCATAVSASTMRRVCLPGISTVESVGGNLLVMTPAVSVLE